MITIFWVSVLAPEPHLRVCHVRLVLIVSTLRPRVSVYIEYHANLFLSITLVLVSFYLTLA